jgi:hypothetical protein
MIDAFYSNMTRRLDRGLLQASTIRRPSIVLRMNAQQKSWALPLLTSLITSRAPDTVVAEW